MLVNVEKNIVPQGKNTPFIQDVILYNTVNSTDIPSTALGFMDFMAS